MNSILVAAASSGQGKTTVTTGLIKHLTDEDMDIAPFKCGPDYIDTAHLAKAAGKKARNLDSVMMGRDAMFQVYSKGAASDMGIVEGAMGFFDGIDPLTFKGSSYDIAKSLNIPVLLVLDCSSMSYSAAAVLRGIASMGEDVRFAGVVLNNIASSRHEKLVIDAVKNHTEFEIIGSIPRGEEAVTPSRHLGIQTAMEQEESYFAACAKMVKANVNTELLLEKSRVRPIRMNSLTYTAPDKKAFIAMDEAFQFYYQENLDVLEDMGYEIKFFSPLKNETVEGADFVYLGGGYPELHAKELAKNKKTMESIKSFSDNGGKLYAECGGMMYLSKGIHTAKGFSRMTGIFDAECEMCEKRQALGYVRAKLVADCSFGKVGQINIGHEFHYSKLRKSAETPMYELTRVTDGKKSSDGMMKNNTFASYTHLHFLADDTFIKIFLR